MHGFDTSDYGARGYYPASGRFMTVDPLAELTPSISPYAYCKGNPVRNIDPSGMWTESDTGYRTSDPDEINEFYNQQKSKGNNNKPEVPSPFEEF